MNNRILDWYDETIFEKLSKVSPNVYFYVADMKKQKSMWSENAIDFFSLSSNIIDNDEWSGRIHDDDISIYYKSFQDIVNHVTQNHNCIFRIRNKNNEYVWVRCLGYMTYDENGTIDKLIGFVSDLGPFSITDSITGLWSFKKFRNDLSYILSNNQHSGAVIFMDIMNFRRINDEYGHKTGDRVLNRISQHFIEIIGKTITTYSLGGDSFAFIIREGNKADVLELKSKIDDILNAILIDNKIMHFNSVFAAVLFPDNGTYLDQIIDNVNFALEVAKQNNEDEVVFYTNELYIKKSRAIRVKEAVMNCELNNFEGLWIVFQPVIDAQTDKCIGAEALLRWDHENIRNLNPSEFIPIMEETKKIIPVGKWVVNEVFKYASTWIGRNGFKRVSINVSYVQIKEPDFLNYILEKLNEYHISPESLLLELTESCRIENLEILSNSLSKFEEAGISIALDDFGTGYASLAVLRNISANVVKLDRSMTTLIDNLYKDRILVEYIVSFCKKLNIAICAEGIETKSTLDVIKEIGADSIQGYVYDKPLQVDEFYQKYIDV